MSLAFTAASLDNINTINENDIIQRKKQTTSHNRTQRRIHTDDFNIQKVNSVLESIHNMHDDDNEQNYNPKGINMKINNSNNIPLNPLQNFNPPEKPISVGGERTKKPEGYDNLVPNPNSHDDLELQELSQNFMDDKQKNEYYKKFTKHTPPSYNSSYNSYSSERVGGDNNQVLLEKINYMINLLEDQQDEKIGSVTEEVILYCFLGIFIIFISDSFVKVGKYIR